MVDDFRRVITNQREQISQRQLRRVGDERVQLRAAKTYLNIAAPLSELFRIGTEMELERLFLPVIFTDRIQRIAKFAGHERCLICKELQRLKSLSAILRAEMKAYKKKCMAVRYPQHLVKWCNLA